MTTAHEAVDEQSDYAEQLAADRRNAARNMWSEIAGLSACTGNCNQGRLCDCCPPSDCSMCAPEYLTPADKPRKRLGGIGSVHRAILHRSPTFTCSFIVALSLVCALLWVLR